MRKYAPQLLTIGLSALGVALFAALNFPLPFLLGPMTICLFAALAGAKLRDLGWFQVLMRTILGVTVGASITPDVLAELPEMALSVALVPPMLLLVGLIGVPYFTRICKYDPVTAYYAAMPGGLQDMLAFGEEAGGRVRTMSLIHATRVLIIVVLVPVLMTVVWGYDLNRPPGAPASALPLGEMAWMVLAAIGGWLIAARIKLFGASILGPMIAAAALSLGGLIEHRPPAEAILAAQFFIGLAVGAKYVGITARELRVDVIAGIGYCLILAILALIFAEIVALSGLAPQLDAFLAFAPGGQSEMAVIAIIAGADLAFVIVHHLTRMILIILFAPLVRRWMTRGG